MFDRDAVQATPSSTYLLGVGAGGSLAFAALISAGVFSLDL